MRVSRVASLIPFILIMFVSCYWNSLYTEGSDEEYPDMILENSSYTYGQPDRNPLKLNAARITIMGDGSSELENVKFSQGTGEESELWGSCKSAKSKDNSTITMTGNVVLYQKEDNITISCESLEWDDGSQTVSASGKVYVSYKDGTEITAEGFSAKLKTNEYIFEKIIEGRFTND